MEGCFIASRLRECRTPGEFLAVLKDMMVVDVTMELMVQACFPGNVHCFVFISFQFSLDGQLRPPTWTTSKP